MSDQTWERIEAIIDEALTLPEEQRKEFVNYACADDEELKSEVTLLLNSISDSEGWLEEPNQYKEDFYKEMVNDPEAAVPGSSLIDRQIGPYRVRELLGEGGMGLVFLAERTDGTFEHQVALKVIREGMDTEQNIRRFQQEQRILAGLSHPNIAGILDGGVTDDGLPYLIMEYVDGTPIDIYCDENRLSIEERLKLIKTVSSVVQYAHTNLVIHRDLKPANILVDKEGHVQILDFGIAKLLDPDHTDGSGVQTRTGARILTFGYAAPEQIQGQTITTAVDNYALGVLTYKLLTGVIPFNKEGKTVSEIQNLIVNERPPAPSERFKKLSPDQQRELGGQRQSTSQKTIQHLQGDLDSIILKNLRKEPEARYNSPAQLREDIERHEKGLPVSAREGKVRYHISKFIKRHTKSIALITIFLLAILGFGLFYTHQITQERNRARTEAEKATQVKNFLVNILQNSDPFSISGDPNLTLREVLDKGAQRIQTELRAYPALQADLLLTMGLAYANLALYPRAEVILQEALKAQDKLTEEDIQLKGNILQQIASSYMWQGEFSKSDSIHRLTESLFQQNYGTVTPKLAPVYNDWGLLKQEWGKLHDAEQLYKKSIQLYDPAYIDTTALATIYHNLATVFKDQGSLDSAVTYYHKALDLRYKTVSEEHPGTATTLSLLASALNAKGNLLQADSLQRMALRIRKRTLPPRHPHIAASQVRLGQVLIKLNKAKETEDLLNKAIPILTNSFPEQHWRVSAAKGVRAVAWMLQGRFKESEQPLLNAFQTFKDRFGNSDWRTQEALKALVQLYTVWNKPQKARQFKKLLV